MLLPSFGGGSGIIGSLLFIIPFSFFWVIHYSLFSFARYSLFRFKFVETILYSECQNPKYSLFIYFRTRYSLCIIPLPPPTSWILRNVWRAQASPADLIVKIGLKVGAFSLISQMFAGFRRSWWCDFYPCFDRDKCINLGLDLFSYVCFFCNLFL